MVWQNLDVFCIGLHRSSKSLLLFRKSRILQKISHQIAVSVELKAIKPLGLALLFSFEEQ